MDFALIGITVLSLLTTLAMGVVTWRLVREERRRAAARLAALAAELQRARPRAPAPDRSPARADLVGSAPLGRPPAVGSPRVDPADRLFGPSVAATPGAGARVAALGAAVAAAIAAIVLVATAVTGRDTPARDADSRQPVELLALEHASDGALLDIRGSVRNPDGGVATDRLAVVAMAFDEAGALVASEQAPVAEPALAPGAASAFAVRVPATGVSRYRISFLLDDATIPHVDRRPANTPGGSS